jgi:hypothetical protein
LLLAVEILGKPLVLSESVVGIARFIAMDVFQRDFALSNLRFRAIKPRASQHDQGRKNRNIHKYSTSISTSTVVYYVIIYVTIISY